MKKITHKARLFAPVLLRYGMALVVLWFSLQQFIHPTNWTPYIPDSVLTLTGLTAPTVVFLNAVFELVCGAFLLLGKFTRLAALLLALHLLDIMWVLGYGEIAVRDFGLAMGLLSVFLHGPDILSVDTMTTKEDAQPTTPTTTLQNDNARYI